MTDQAAKFYQRLEGWVAALSLDDKAVVLEWVERALRGDPNDEDDVEAGLIVSCVEGHVEIAGVEDGEVMFRLTQAGHDHVLHGLLDKPEYRELLSRMNVGTGRPPISDPPKDPQ